MAIITEHPTLRLRKRVACFGGLPSSDDQRSFIERGFSIESCTDADLLNPIYLSGTASVVFTQNADRQFTKVVTYLEKYAQMLLDYDCQIYVRLAENKNLEKKAREIVINGIVRLKLPSAGLSFEERKKLGPWARKEGNPSPPFVHLCDTAINWSIIANLNAEYPAGKAPDRNLIINVEDKDGNITLLDSSRELLIRRAFWDCVNVHLEEMPGGKSEGISVYRAYADLYGHLGRWPLPYFIKLGGREKIFVEYANYKDMVDPYIPFHLGPHLIHERCCLGATEGVIVGDYVEESESLQDCARDGRAVTAIACLFNRTLLGWYRAAKNNQKPLSKSLSFPYRPLMKANLRINRAYALGATKCPKELLALFKRCVSAVPVLVGPTHGDLHATNILVRATDAIVIDFFAHSDKPLVYDAASLEVSLLVDGFAGDTRDIQTWLNSIISLYKHYPLVDAHTHPHPKDPSSWFYACVRQIRLYGRQMERHKDQYAAALAIALLKKASKDRNLTGLEDDRRAATYVLAESVLSTTFGRAEYETPAVESL